MPFGVCHRYDMIIDDGSKLERAQCKTGHIRNGVIVFKTCNTNGFTGKEKPYYNQADVFLIYCPDNQGYYKIPVDTVGHRSCSLRLDRPKNGQTVRMAKDFEF